MATVSIDDSLITSAVIDFLANTADLSTNESGNTGTIQVGDHIAPPAPDEQDLASQISVVTGLMRPYLVVYQVPGSYGVARSSIGNSRGGYAGGTPSTKVIRYQLAAVAGERRAAQQLAIYAADRLSESSISVAGHELSVWERVGHGASDRVGQLFQWIELVEVDVARAP